MSQPTIPVPPSEPKQHQRLASLQDSLTVMSWRGALLLIALISVLMNASRLFIDRSEQLSSDGSSSIVTLSGVSGSLALATFLGIAFAFFSLFVRDRRQRRSADSAVSVEVQIASPLIKPQLRSAHLVQIIAQGSVYVGWCMYWETARDHLPLLGAQICFAYLIDMGLSWLRYPSYRIGLGPIPIVMSTNLFLFFTDAHFVWQWLLIIVALGSREMLRWRRGGRDVHIFNPSAIALSLFMLCLIYTETVHWTWGEAIARTHGNGPYSYEIMFGAGLLVSSLFSVGFTISSAAITTLLIGEFYFAQTGIFRYVDTGIPIAVFLGMNLLVTDPVSSPWRRDAKLLYGLLYGVSVFVLYGVLRDLERTPTPDDVGLSAAFCDKLLAVPLLNLGARALDGVMTRLWGDADRGVTRRVLTLERALYQRLGGAWVGRACFVALWSGLFFWWVQPELREHRGKDVSFWVKACEGSEGVATGKPHPYACENLRRMYLRACESGALPACHNLAISLEEHQPQDAERLYLVACEGGQLQSCNHLGGMLYRRGDQEKDRSAVESARGLLKTACDGEVAEACTRLAQLLRSPWVDRTTWGERDWRQIWTMLKSACQHREPYACMELSDYHLMPPEVARQRCYQGDQLACVTIEEAINMLKQASNPNLHPLHPQARDQLSVACEAEMQLACVNLGWMLWRGDGGPREAQRGLSLVEGGCQRGIKAACERAQWMRARDNSASPLLP